MSVISIENLAQCIETFSPIQSAYLAENCIVALENHNHLPGCKLTVTISLTGEPVRNFQLDWRKKEPIKRAGYEETSIITKNAAKTITFFLCSPITGYDIIQRARIGCGFDFWLGYNDTNILYDPINFLKARLEVSGISKENKTNRIRARIKRKIKQVAVSDYTNLPAYISIVEMATPKVYFIKK